MRELHLELVNTMTRDSKLKIDRYLGCLVGLAVGDAVGTTLEFRRKDSYEHITDMCGGGPFKLDAGQWTDDTSMALCLAHSLVNQSGFDPVDQMNRYCNWFQYGYLSSTGECFDIGATVSKALNKYLSNGNPFAGSTDPLSAGNGSIMRLAPIAMYYSPDVEKVIHFAGESSRTTHAAEECIDACSYFGALLHLALHGIAKEHLFKSNIYEPTTDKVKQLQSGYFIKRTRKDINGTGYVIASLEAALWCFYSTTNYRDAILTAANLGNDADTTAAICGQIAGAYYGHQSIPESWREKISLKNEIKGLALALMNKKNKTDNHV